MATKRHNGIEFITVVTVGDSKKLRKPLETFSKDTSFVTVLSIGDETKNEVAGKQNGVKIELNAPVPEEVTLIERVNVYRLPGERLGFGLKFEGGTKSAECVKRLYIQSCAPDSPASKVLASWGPLGEGDEIISIGNNNVENMTRIDCVRCLKESPVFIELSVKRRTHEVCNFNIDETLSLGADKKRPPPPPPPIPPRKIPKRIQMKTNFVVPPTEYAEDSTKPSARNRTMINEKDTEEDKSKGIKRLPSPRGMQRPTTPRQMALRDRRLSDGSINPPDAEKK